jgi:hypothetical protein
MSVPIRTPTHLCFKFCITNLFVCQIFTKLFIIIFELQRKKYIGNDVLGALSGRGASQTQQYVGGQDEAYVAK